VPSWPTTGSPPSTETEADGGAGIGGSGVGESPGKDVAAGNAVDGSVVGACATEGPVDAVAGVATVGWLELGLAELQAAIRRPAMRSAGAVARFFRRTVTVVPFTRLGDKPLPADGHGHGG
jgi:hypothetical protein